MNLFKRLYKSAIMRTAWGFYRLFPMDKTKIVFSNFYGRGLGDNAKYILEKMMNERCENKIIWLINNDSEKASIPKEIRTCYFGSSESIYHLMTAKVWIDNCRKYFIMLKRKNQLYIQTWHGGGAQKKCELDAIDKLGKKYEKAAKRDARNTDLMISESRFMTDLYHRSFWYSGPVYECGYPRYDILLKQNEDLISKVYGHFCIDRRKEIVLYAPTFRVDHSFDAYNIDFQRLIRNLNERFGKEFIVLVHLHPNVARKYAGINYNKESVINATFYPDTQELIAVASVLIGDYSSINYDFALKRMPVFRYVADLEEYRDDRDLYFKFDEYPYPYAKNNDELEKLILGFDNNKYLEKLEVFFDKLGAIANPNSSQDIVDLVNDFMKSKSKNEFIRKNKGKFIY